MDPLRLFLLDQGIPVEYELDKFNTPHTGTTLFHPQNWLCRSRCLIPLQHLATTSPLGNIFWRHSRFSTNKPETQTHSDFNIYFLKQQTWFLLNNGKHNPSHVQRHTLLSQLYHNSISSLYLFPLPQGLQHKRKLYIPCCQLKTIIKTFRHLGTSLLYLLLKLSEEVTKHTHTCYNYSLLKITKLFTPTLPFRKEKRSHNYFHYINCPISRVCRIHQQHLCRWVRPSPMSVLDMMLNYLMVRFQ